jgi:hypothetical protein
VVGEGFWDYTETGNVSRIFTGRSSAFTILTVEDLLYARHLWKLVTFIIFFVFPWEVVKSGNCGVAGTHGRIIKWY